MQDHAYRVRSRPHTGVRGISISCGRRNYRGNVASKWNRCGIAVRERPGGTLGGGGFKSLRRSLPATAPTLMRRFFSGPKTFDFFQRKSNFSNSRRQIHSKKQGSSIDKRAESSIYFLSRPERILHPKKCREIPGGGRVR
jgi:hypothetical protein